MFLWLADAFVVCFYSFLIPKNWLEYEDLKLCIFFRLDWSYHKTLEDSEIRLVRSGVVADNYKARVSIKPLATLVIADAVVADTGEFFVE